MDIYNNIIYNLENFCCYKSNKNNKSVSLKDKKTNNKRGVNNIINIKKELENKMVFKKENKNSPRVPINL